MKIYFLLTLIAISTFSCNKSKITLADNLETKQEQQLLKTKFVNKFEEKDGILFFKSWEEVQDVMEELILEEEKYIENFYGIYSNKTEDELEEIIDSLSWNSSKPYHNFEEAFNLNSLREKIELNKQTANDSTIFNHWDSYSVEKELSSLLNSDGIIVVNGEVYLFLQNGVICTGNLNQLSKIRSITNDNYYLLANDKEITIFGEENTLKNSKCILNKVTNWEYAFYSYQGKQRRLRGRLIVRNLFGFSYIKAETQTDYKKKNNWKNWKAPYISAHTNGSVRPSCSHTNLLPAGSNAHKYNKSSVSVKNNFVGGYFAAFPGELGSVHTATATGPNATLYISL